MSNTQTQKTWATGWVKDAYGYQVLTGTMEEAMRFVTRPACPGMEREVTKYERTEQGLVDTVVLHSVSRGCVWVVG